MTERERIHAIMDHMRLPRGQYVLSGSAVMVLHGIEREKEMGDLDIYLATRPWFFMYDQAMSSWSSGRSSWSLFTTNPDDETRRVDPPYLYRELYGLEVNIFFSWRRRGVGDVDVAFLIHNAVEVDGLPCIWLQFLLDWKEEMGRAKDIDDIRLMKQYLAEHKDVV